MQTIINSVEINSRVAAAEGWSVTKFSNCMMQLLQKEKVRLETVMEKLDQKLRAYAGSAYEAIKNLHPSQFGDEDWEQACAEVIYDQMVLWGDAHYYFPCVDEVAYCLDVEPSNHLAYCVEQVNQKFSDWVENIVGRD